MDESVKFSMVTERSFELRKVLWSLVIKRLLVAHSWQISEGRNQNAKSQ